MPTGQKVKLRDKRLADAVNDYVWQTDAELAELDATQPLTTSFIQYLAEYKNELNHSYLTRQQFAIETQDGRHIGNCAYYNIDETRGQAELGIMIGDRDYWNEGYGSDAVATLVNHIFCQTKLKRIYLKTLEHNNRAQGCFQRCGFVPFGRMAHDGFSFLLMELPRSRWQEQRLKDKNQDVPLADSEVPTGLTNNHQTSIIRAKTEGD